MVMTGATESKDDLKINDTADLAEAAQPHPLMVSPEYIQQQARSIALLGQLTRDVLVRGRDYGRIPGTPADSLWDPGASQIIGAFNSHIGRRRIIHLIDQASTISLIIEVPILTNGTNIEVGSGLGAASTREAKHKYRWVADPASLGYDEVAIKTLKTKTDNGKKTYRITNPERGELLNTIVKMASKRAEVDGAQGLPGVASTLREMFCSNGKRREPDWASYHGKLRQMGLTEEQAHQYLGVESTLDWLEKGKTLDQAIKFITNKLAKEEQGQPESPNQPASDRDPDTITTLPMFWKACHDDFGLGADAVLSELNYSSPSDVKNLPDCYRRIAAVHKR